MGLVLVWLLLAATLPILAQDGGDASTTPATTAVAPDRPVARFLLFYGTTCPHCHEVMENYLPTVYEKYGDQVEYQYIEIYGDSNNYLTMLALEAELNVPEERRGLVPTLVIGDKVLMGGLEIPEKLEGYIDEYLAQGGVDFPDLENLPEVVLPTPEPSVEILVFLDVTRPEYDAVNSLIGSLLEQYSGKLQPYAADLKEPDNAALVERIQAALGVDAPSGAVQVLVGRHLLVGIDQIEAELPGLIESYLAQGGVDLSLLEEVSQPGTSATPAPGEGTPETPAVQDTPSPFLTPAAAPPIYLAYFEQAGCQECARTTYDLRVVQERYPQLVVESYSMEDAGSKELNEWLCERYGVLEEKRLSTPMIFVGDDVLLDTEATLSNLLEVVAQYEAAGAERTWSDFDPSTAGEGLVDRFKSFGVLTVLGAGLIDGLNPCAFATLVFFISYLTITGRKGRDILFVGVAFALGVFLTYLLVGVGLLRIVQSLSFFTSLGRWVYLLTALLCVGLAIVTFRDFFTSRAKGAGEIALKLPVALRRRINKVIRENTQVRSFVAMALVSGFVISLLELACTGQVYLPTIIYVMSRPELAAQAFLYLVLYCLMFILPLIVVFVLSYLGTTSDQLAKFINQHTSSIKLITGFVFVGLALWMFWTLLPLFGVASPWNWVTMVGVLVVIGAGVLGLQLFKKPAPAKKKASSRRSRA
jgi:cytochrome c biogenesis protein CcdA